MYFDNCNKAAELLHCHTIRDETFCVILKTVLLKSVCNIKKGNKQNLSYKRKGSSLYISPLKSLFFWLATKIDSEVFFLFASNQLLNFYTIFPTVGIN